MNGACLDNVLVVDPGTLFLQPCQFMQEGRPVLNFGDGYHAAHFEHMARLLPSLHRMIAYSGIAHCMLLKRQWVQQLTDETELAHNGEPFWKSWLSSIDTAEQANGASEAEVWFNFCLRFHAQDIVIRRFRWATVESVDAIQAEPFDYVKLANPVRNAADRARLDEVLSLRATPPKVRDMPAGCSMASATRRHRRQVTRRWRSIPRMRSRRVTAFMRGSMPATGEGAKRMSGGSAMAWRRARTSSPPFFIARFAIQRKRASHLRDCV